MNQALRNTLLLLVAGSAALLSGCADHARVATTTTTRPPDTTTTAPPLATSPLTGLPQPNAAQAQAPAVVVKIDNVDPARPQSGIDQADIVYEEMVEAGLTRLAAVFQSQYPTVVGPVRSGRLTDEAIADDLSHPVFAYSGTNALFLPILRSQPVTDADDGNQPGQFWRVGFQAAPHNLYTNVDNLAKLSPAQAPPLPLFLYLPQGQPFSGPGATPIAQIDIPFPSASVTWTWSAAQGAWLRTQNGTADVVRGGPQLSAQNVIVEFVPYVVSATANEGGITLGIPTGELVGSGAVWVLSQGKLIKGNWQRDSLTDPTVYEDTNGLPIGFTPGRTWVELVPVGTVPTVG